VPGRPSLGAQTARVAFDSSFGADNGDAHSRACGSQHTHARAESLSRCRMHRERGACAHMISRSLHGSFYEDVRNPPEDAA
jgi:hypothetical protein